MVNTEYMFQTMVTRFYELENNTIVDQAPNLQINRVTGGRAVVVGNIISEKSDIFAANERGSNFLYVNNNGKFIEVAKNYGIDDELQNGRGTTLSDIFYDGAWILLMEIGEDITVLMSKTMINS